jgi:protein-tyrosine phosphatase
MIQRHLEDMEPKLYWIDSVGPGKIAISARPRGGDWLEDEVRGWHREGIDVVVSLLTGQEMSELGLERESDESRKNGLIFLNLPIPDRGVPPDTVVAGNFVENVRKQLEAGRTIAIHCRQGIGRSGMVAAALLVRQGVSPSEAIQHVSQVRGLPIPETEEQRSWVFDFLPVASVPKGRLHQ